MPNQTDSIDTFARAAADIAMRAAIEYAREHDLEVVALQHAESLCAAIRRHVQAAVGPALADARLALEAGMGWAAEQTFRASIALAGVEAAKEVL